jgi:hypothetical protein
MQCYRQMQRITGPQAEGWILEQLSRLAKTATIECAQFYAALQQALELRPSGAWRAWGLRP